MVGGGGGRLHPPPPRPPPAHSKVSPFFSSATMVRFSFWGNCKGKTETVALKREDSKNRPGESLQAEQCFSFLHLQLILKCPSLLAKFQWRATPTCVTMEVTKSTTGVTHQVGTSGTALLLQTGSRYNQNIRDAAANQGNEVVLNA